jgi:hypothetical protein
VLAHRPEQDLPIVKRNSPSHPKKPLAGPTLLHKNKENLPLTRIEIMQMPVEKLCLEMGNVLERFDDAEMLQLPFNASGEDFCARKRRDELENILDITFKRLARE